MVKVTVCGAAGGIGQPLSLLLKLNKNVTSLSLFDVVNAPGVGADLSHISTDSSTKAYLPSSKEDKTALAESLKGTDLVIIPAGVPRKPGMTRDDLFNINASIVRDLAQGIAENSPKAFVLVISNPVNSTVPIVAETLKKNNVFDAHKVFGVTTLDVVRANTFISHLFESESKPSDFNVRVIGGHSGETIVPVFSVGSSKKFYEKLSPEDRQKLVHRVQFGGDEVVQAKSGAGSATLSMAYAGYRLAEALLLALSGSLGEVECAYLNLDSSVKGASEAKKLVKDLDFFSLPVKLGKSGIEEVKYDIINELNTEEKKLLETAVGQLSTNIKKGVDFIQK